MRRSPFLISLLALFIVATFFSGCGQEPAQRQPVAHFENESADQQKHFELAVSMGRIQRYHQKWWASGHAGNAELAGFYLHEMEEAMEEIADAKVIDEGIDVSANMRTYGLAAIEALETKLNDQGVEAMHADAGLLANTCNTCHQVCDHPYIRIVPPTAVFFPDQDFSPKAK